MKQFLLLPPSLPSKKSWLRLGSEVIKALGKKDTGSVQDPLLASCVNSGKGLDFSEPT